MWPTSEVRWNAAGVANTYPSLVRWISPARWSGSTSMPAEVERKFVVVELAERWLALVSRAILLLLLLLLLLLRQQPPSRTVAVHP
jgi:hypothetical protein